MVILQHFRKTEPEIADTNRGEVRIHIRDLQLVMDCVII